jgi:hypothetical protein
MPGAAGLPKSRPDTLPACLVRDRLARTCEQIAKRRNGVVLVRPFGGNAHEMTPLYACSKDPEDALSIRGWPTQGRVFQPDGRIEPGCRPNEARRRPGVQTRIDPNLDLDRPHG